jgi:hypothetical protein
MTVPDRVRQNSGNFVSSMREYSKAKPYSHHVAPMIEALSRK